VLIISLKNLLHDKTQLAVAIVGVNLSVIRMAAQRALRPASLGGSCASWIMTHHHGANHEVTVDAEDSLEL
jgi:chloramphenicol 3-O-phosphotransferase